MILTLLRRLFLPLFLVSISQALLSQAVKEHSTIISGFGSDQRSLWLEGLPGPVNERYFFTAHQGRLESFDDGTAHFIGEVYNELSADHRWKIDVWFKDKEGWSSWKTKGRSWKGNADLVGTSYKDWDYYVMDQSKDNHILGLGLNDGSKLQLNHRPSNLLYGFQVGLAANDKNNLEGASFWFDYTGVYQGQAISGIGDFNLEGNCLQNDGFTCAPDAQSTCRGHLDPELLGLPTLACDGEYQFNYVDEVLSEDCEASFLRHWTVIGAAGDSVFCAQSVSLKDVEAPTISVEQTVFMDCDYDLNEVVSIGDCDPSAHFEVQVIDSLWHGAEDCENGQLRTQTPGGWGAEPAGNNPGTYLHTHFDQAFPNGLTIGCHNSLHFTSASSITAFLPSGSTPTFLPAGNMVDPVDYNNVFAGHLVALTLSLTFDALDPDFGFAPEGLGDQFFVSGPFMGWTVSELHEYANQAIGGCLDPERYSALNDAVASVNENYVDGTRNKGSLSCTAPWDCYLSLSVKVDASDACGNQSSRVVQIRVVDSSEPEILSQPQDTTVMCEQVPAPGIEWKDDCFTALTQLEVREEHFSGACLPTLYRRYVLTDQCNRKAEAEHYISQRDTTPPVFLNSPAEASISCGENHPVFIPEVSDACSEVTIDYSESHIPQNCGEELWRTWTAKDICGNSASLTQRLLVTDEKGPEPNFWPEEVQISCGESFPLVELSFTDDCAGAVTVSFTEEVMEDNVCEYWMQRRWVATDACGNETLVIQDLYQVDNQPPVFAVLPKDQILMCGTNADDFIPVLKDNCSDVSLEYSQKWLDGSACPALQKTWIARDFCGNTSVAQQVQSFIDVTAPVITGVPADTEAFCGTALEVPDVQATDNCSELHLLYDEQTESLGCGQLLTRTWTAMDACGNKKVASQRVKLLDQSAPVFIADENIIVDCHRVNDEPYIEVVDDCGGALQVSHTDSVYGDGCQYAIIRSWTAIDNCGNRSNFKQFVSVVDQDAPVFTWVPEDATLACGSLALMESPVVEDNCSSVSVSMTTRQNEISCGFEIIRTWTAVDDCGNTSVASQHIRIVDQEAPELEGAPSDLYLDCGDQIPLPVDLMATDNCSAEPEVLFTEERLDGDCPNNYTLRRTWTATDDCGNMGVEIQEIHVSDTEAPVFDFIPADLEADCANIPEPATLTASDNCSEVRIEYNQEALTGGCPHIVRTWVATDACGNSSMAVQHILVSDLEAPLILGIPGDLIADCEAIPELPVPEISDNCDNKVDLSVNVSVVGEGCSYFIIRTWIASDDCGNTTTVSQSIEVIDQSPPVFVDPKPIIEVDCSELEGLPYPKVIDECGGAVNISFSDEVESALCSALILRTYTATDLCGNSAEFSQEIRVTDKRGPEFTDAPKNLSLSCGVLPEVPQVMATDACADIKDIRYNSFTEGEICDQHVYRTWVATDVCGNSTTYTQYIHMVDDEAPVFEEIPSDIYVDCGQEVPEVVHPQATDNCDPALGVIFHSITEQVTCGEMIYRSWTATDACGNQKVFNQTVHHYDMSPPDLSFAHHEIHVTCGNIPQPERPSATDSCHPESDIVLQVEERVVIGACPYTIERNWTATDVCGNVGEITQYIYVLDEEAPVLIGLPENIVVSCGDLPDAPVVYAADNCSAAPVLEMTEAWSGTACSRILTRTWTAKDLCGNSTAHSQLITLLDDEAPVFLSEPAEITLSCSEDVPVIFPEVSDNCGSTALTFADEVLSGSCDSEATIYRTWRAEDDCGNESKNIQLIHIVDEQAPVFDFQPEWVQVDCNHLPEVAMVTATDVCEGPVEVVLTESVVWEEGDDNACQLGNVIGSSVDVALLLPGIEGINANYIFGAEGGTLDRDIQQGTAHLYGQVYNVDNANQSWYVDVYLSDAKDWDAWSALGRSYKDDAEVAGDDYKEWVFYLLDASRSQLIGKGLFEGSLLSLAHAPSSLKYGFQLGLGANNRNAAYGMSGWFYFDGLIAETAQTGMGDVMTENNCCRAHQISYTWSATDCAGNVAMYTQEVSVVNQFPWNPDVLQYPAVDANQQLLEVYGTTGSEFQIRFTAPETGMVSLEMRDATGKNLAQLFNGMVEGGRLYSMRQDKSALPSGLYIFQLITNSGSYVDREMVGQ